MMNAEPLILALGTTASLAAALAQLLLHLLSRLLGLATRNAQRLPLRAPPVLGQEDDLPDVVGVVRGRAMDGLHHRVFLSADGDRARQVFGLERGEGVEHDPVAG